MRAARALVTTPNWELLIEPADSGTERDSRRLKISTRNCSDFVFGDSRILQQCQVPVVQAWAMKETPARISDVPERFQGKQGGIKIGVAVPRIRITQNLARSEIRNVCSAGTRE